MGELLKRLAGRRIVQTAAVYAGGAWLLLEATAFFVDNYALSTRILDVAVLLIVLGLPAALIISWYHGEKGRQQVARAEKSLLLTLAVLAAIGTYRITFGGEAETVDPGRASAGAPTGAVAPAEDLGELSVAVLPFVNSTGQDSLDWLGPGMSDMLTSSLVRTGQLRVVSPQRLFELLRQAGREETERIPDDVAMDIVSRSGARRMVRGSILGQPGDLAVDAQLIDLRDGTVVAAERVRGDDVFELSDSVAIRLSGHVVAVGALSGGPGERERVAVRPGDHPRPPIALVGDMEKLREFQVGIRSTWDSLGKDSIGARYHLVDLLEQMPGREQEARKALEEILRIDSTQAKAWVRLARVSARQGDEAAAENALEKFGEVVADPARVALEQGRVLESMGRVDDARAAYRQALREQPDATHVMDRLAGTWLRAGDPAGARRAVEPWTSSGNAPARAEALLLTGDAWAWEGRFDRALASYEEAQAIGESESRPDIRADALEAEISIRWVQDTTWGGSRLGRYRSIWTLLELGRLEEARNLVDAAERVLVDEADRLLPVDYHVILYAGGRVREALGRSGAAVGAYEELVGRWGDALESVPRLADAPERLRRLRG